MELIFGDLSELGDIEVKEVPCRTALSISGLESDYAINPYRGCSHGCIYCYAPFVLKEKRTWGTFVDIRRTIPAVLAKELKSKPPGTVRLGSVTDPYQPVEKIYQLTRLCLQQLKKAEIPVIIQTKSDLVLRDIDLFQDMDVDVGMTVTSIDDTFTKTFEPGSPMVGSRLEALGKLNDAGINTWAFIGPLIPGENDHVDGLTDLKNELLEVGTSEIYLDKLNMREGIWSKLEGILHEDRLAEYRCIFSQGSKYFEEKKEIYRVIGKLVF